MIRRPPRSTLLTHSFPTRRSSDLWYHPPAGEREPLVVFFHGNGSDLGNAFLKMRPFVEAGFGLLAAGYRGYSGNPGKPSEPGLTADDRSLLAWAAAEGYGRQRLVSHGEYTCTAVRLTQPRPRPPPHP